MKKPSEWVVKQSWACPHCNNRDGLELEWWSREKIRCRLCNTLYYPPCPTLYTGISRVAWSNQPADMIFELNG